MPRADRCRRPGRAGVDRQQDGPGALDGRASTRTGARESPACGRRRAIPRTPLRFRRAIEEVAVGRGMRSRALVADQVRPDIGVRRARQRIDGHGLTVGRLSVRGRRSDPWSGRRE